MVRRWEQAGRDRPVVRTRADGRGGAIGASAMDDSTAGETAGAAHTGEDSCVAGRKEADRQLYEKLAETRFGGPSWDLFATELARYAHGILMAWLVTGELFQQCRNKGRSLGLPPDDWTGEDRAELANETVARALISFRDNALIGGGWRHEGGASLTTYFIGACIYEFPNVFRRWQSEQNSWRRCDQVELTPEPALAPVSDDPCAIAMQRLWIGDLLEAIPNPATRKAIVLQGLKYTYDEIAELLGLTPGAVAQLLCRERRRQQQQPKVPHD